VARPTPARIRQMLDDLGLPQVDERSWFDGTMPEILRVALDAGPLAPLPTFNFLQRNNFVTAAVADEAGDITGANANTIRIIKNMRVEIVTGNIDQLIFQYSDGTVLSEIWNDSGSPQFPIGRYIGTDNDATRAWGALGLHTIMNYPPELTTIPVNQRQLQIRLISAAAVVKQVRLDFNVTEFDSRLYPGGVW